MRRLGSTVVHGLAIAALVCGMATTPAFADHDNDHHGHWRNRGRHYQHHGEWDRPRTSFYWYPGYSRYYYRPRAEYYASPEIYVPPPPPPPSFGLNLVFPIH